MPHRNGVQAGVTSAFGFMLSSESGPVDEEEELRELELDENEDEDELEKHELDDEKDELDDENDELEDENEDELLEKEELLELELDLLELELELQDDCDDDELEPHKKNSIFSIRHPVKSSAGVKLSISLT